MKRKLLLIVTSLILCISLTGCGSSDKPPVKTVEVDGIQFEIPEDWGIDSESAEGCTVFRGFSANSLEGRLIVESFPSSMYFSRVEMYEEEGDVVDATFADWPAECIRYTDEEFKTNWTVYLIIKDDYFREVRYAVGSEATHAADDQAIIDSAKYID